MRLPSEPATLADAGDETRALELASRLADELAIDPAYIGSEYLPIRVNVPGWGTTDEWRRKARKTLDRSVGTARTLLSCLERLRRHGPDYATKASQLWRFLVTEWGVPRGWIDRACCTGEHDKMARKLVYSKHWQDRHTLAPEIDWATYDDRMSRTNTRRVNDSITDDFAEEL